MKVSAAPGRATHEAAISLRARLVGAEVVDPAAPLPALPRPPQAPLPPTPSEVEREAIERVLAHLGEVAVALQAQQSQRLQEMQHVAVELAVAVASRLIHERLESGDFAVETLVREVLQRLEPGQAVTVYLHPDDLALLQNRLGADQPLLGGGAALRVAADASLGRGDCRGETGDAAILVCVEEQLAEMRRHLLDSLPDAEVERRRAAGDRALKRFPDRRQTA